MTPPRVSWLQSPARPTSASTVRRPAQGWHPSMTSTDPLRGRVPMISISSCRSGAQTAVGAKPASSCVQHRLTGRGHDGLRRERRRVGEALAMRSPRRIGPCRAGDGGEGQRRGVLDVGGEADRRRPTRATACSTGSCVRTIRRRGRGRRRRPRGRALHERAEGVDCPQHAASSGRRAPACRRRVEQRRAHDVQRAVAGVERRRRRRPSACARAAARRRRRGGRHRPVPTSVACGHRSSTASRLPMWSWSSWERKTQRTSSGSTTEKTYASHASRTSEQPVSTITGSAPRITRLLMEKKAPPGSARHRRDEKRVGGDRVGLGVQELGLHGTAFR